MFLILFTDMNNVCNLFRVFINLLVWRCSFFLHRFLFPRPGLTEFIKFVKPAPIDQETSKKAKKNDGGGKKKKQKQGGGGQNLPAAMETMSVSDS